MQDVPQAARFLRKQFWFLMSAVGKVQANLLARPINALYRPPDCRVLGFIAESHSAAATTDAVERNVQVMALGHVHDDGRGATCIKRSAGSRRGAG